MGWQLTFYVLLGFLGAGISGVVAGLAWRHRARPEAIPFMGLMLAIGGWALVYGLQLGFTTQGAQVRWQRLGLAIGGLVPTLWLLFTLRYSGKDTWLTRPWLGVLAFNPLLFGILILTNPSHNLILRDSTMTHTAAGPVVRLIFHHGYYLHIAYAYLLVAAGIGLLGVVFVRASPISRRQTGLLTLGALPPFLGNIAYTLRISVGPLPALDPTPFAFIITGVVFGLALFKFDLLERTPLAQQRALQEMGDGIVVMGTNGEILDMNAVVRDILDPIPTVGDSVTEFVPEDVSSPAEALETFDGRTITTRTDEGHRAYDTEWHVLSDHREKTVGHVVTLRDVTERHRYEQRLVVAQRVLRHNLRNDLNVIRGWAGELENGSATDPETAAQQIVETADDLIDLSEKARTMVRLDELTENEQMTIEIEERLDSLVDEFREEFPDLTIEYSDGCTPVISVPNEDLFEIPIRNLIENAIEHNDAGEPWVGIRSNETDTHVQINIEDNGPEIPAVEHEVLESGTEEQLQHGSGMGLWLTYWSMQTVGGQIRFHTGEQRGNRVVLEFPRDGNRRG